MKTLSLSLACILSLCASLASAHVSLAPAEAEAGKPYRGVLSIGHGCDNAPTTALEVQLPGSPPRLLDTRDKAAVPIEFTAPKNAGPVWLKVVQRCGAASAEWSQVPAQGTSTEGLKNPAVLLNVMTPEQMAAWRMRPSIEDAWVRASVPGQQATGLFMRITANEPTQLVGVSSPVAGVADVHEMKMEGDVMRMRPAGAIDLPVGRAFELKPGGYHVMLQDLKKPAEAGSKVPVTLVFRNARGVESRMELRVPVALQAPGAGAGSASAHSDHKH
jgi:copper(I)-binding protein